LISLCYPGVCFLIGELLCCGFKCHPWPRGYSRSASQPSTIS